MDIQEINISDNSISTPILNVFEKDNKVIKKSVNFGPGADLLMNPNRQTKSSDIGEINISDINDIDIGPTLSGDSLFSDIKIPTSSSGASLGGVSSGPLGGSLGSSKDESINFIKKDILKGTLNKEKSETEDGFKLFNDIPVNPNITPPKKPRMSPKELLKEKFKYLRLLESVEQRGVTLSKKYSMDSSLDEMKGEYETLKAEKEKSNSVKFQGKMLMACVSGLEFLNARFDPFDLKVDGWAEAVNENLEEYDEVFGELHDKYGSKAKMAPELKLLFMLGGSGVMLHMTNTMFKSAMPGMDDIMRQNPDLMQQFTQAAASSMGENNPGLGSFMNMVGQQQQPPRGSPPGPNEGMRIDPPQMNGRPDVDMARSNRRADFNDAENMESNYAAVNENRKEMRGPSDLRDILSGLKTKKINMNKPGSSVSIEELNEMKSDMNKPKRSKRKPKSERNTITLDL